MAFTFKKRPVGKTECNQSVTTARALQHPFSALDRYSPLGDPELKLYESIREAIPVVDSAICKIVRLMGNFRIECEDSRLDKRVENYLKNIKVGPCQKGIGSYLNVFLDQLLTYGTAVGEIIVDADGFPAALYNADLKDIELRRSENGLDVEVYSWGEDMTLSPTPFRDRITVCALNPSPGHIGGNSLLKGLPFVSSILLKIFNTIGTNWERMGNLRFAVTYRPDNSYEAVSATDRANDIAREWSKAMSDTSSVRDFVGVGDIDIKVIGADNQILDSSVPVRQMMEQIVSKTGLPPFLLGLSWSSTARFWKHLSAPLYPAFLPPTALPITTISFGRILTFRTKPSLPRRALSALRQCRSKKKQEVKKYEKRSYFQHRRPLCRRIRAYKLYDPPPL